MDAWANAHNMSTSATWSELQLSISMEVGQVVLLPLKPYTVLQSL